MPDKSDLRQRQALPLRAKVLMTQNRIREWYNHWNGDVCISFSGGKDSTVLAHLVHDLYPDVPMVFSNTGLEYPEIQTFARKMGAEFVRPKMLFSEVISKYGYPIISKEVSQTIYYARRIKNGEAGLETIRRRNDLTANAENPRETVPAGFKTTEYCQRMLQGRSGISKDGRILDEEKEIRWENKKCGKRNQLIVNMTQTTETGVVKTSIFNKDKWLPLCQEAQFGISGKCCGVIKKSPLKQYQHRTGRYPFIGTLTDESKMRENAWLKNGCNAFESKSPSSQPLSFWLEQDILRYIKDNGLEIASVYGEIVSVDKDGFGYDALPGCEYELKCTKCQRTGCIFCGFGAHLDKGETRFQRLAKTHPKQYEYCMMGGAMG